jgi:CheY-like chemotaxis protein
MKDKSMSRRVFLIVDDEPDIRALVCFCLKNSGDFEVLEAQSGEEAIAMSTKHRPALIVMDVRMPGIGGIEACRHLKANPATGSIPVIFLSAWHGEEQAALEAGGVIFLTKPFNPDELIATVRKYITATRGEYIIERQLRRLLFMDSWAILYIGLRDLGSFNEVYGSEAGDDVLSFTNTVIGETVDELGTPDDFIGHMAANHFVIITTPKQAQAIKEKVKGRFAIKVGTFYNFKHREQGYITVQVPDGQDKRAPLMTLAVGLITQDDGPFADIREITEKAAEARREDK